MTITTLQELVRIIPGAELVAAKGGGRRKVAGVSTDTRSLKKGELFLAIRGENFDGHDFIAQAAEKGAAAAVVSTAWYRMNREREHPLPLVVTGDTLEAYGAIAADHRSRFDIPVIAVAGSAGKTTTKDMITAVLSKKYTVLSTQGNLNNRIGVPSMLLRLAPEHQVAVIEIGTNMPGEIAALCRAVRPTHGVITNIGREHLELLGSVEGVAEEEGALFNRLAEHGGTAFVNADDPMLAGMAEGLPKKILYGTAKRADYRMKVGRLNEEAAPVLEITNNRRKGENPFPVQLNTPGKHTAHNALAAAAVGLALGVPKSKVVAALQEYRPKSGPRGGYARLALVRLPDGGRILNDTYNANPDSMLVALKTLEGIRIGRKGIRIAVLGDMAELGNHAAPEHEEIGRIIAATRKIDVVMFFGRYMRRAYEAIAGADGQAGVTSFFFRKKEKLLRVLLHLRGPEDVVLVKGSRSMAMEEIVNGLIAGAEEKGKEGTELPG